MNTTSDPLRVGFIGLGSQGGPMARRIIEAGYPVTLWARRPGTLARVGEHAGHLLRKDVKLIADLAATATAGAEGGTSEPGDAGHGHGEHGATLLAAADAALALMNVSR